MDDASLEKLRDLRRRIAELRKLSETAQQQTKRVIDQSRELLAEPYDPLLTKVSHDPSRKITTRIDVKR